MPSFERFKSTEAFFNPSLAGIETIPLVENILDCINICNTDIRNSLSENIILAGFNFFFNYLNIILFIFLLGGNTMFSGIENRLLSEIKSGGITSVRYKVIATPERKYSVWIGNSIFSTLSTFPKLTASLGEYKEEGPKISHIKFL